ncbi:MAG: hypothetical protein ABJA79_10820 [Parafilimonas sp.]
MPYKIITTDLFASDIQEALDYYDPISISLNIKFENELNEALDKLVKNPHHYFNLSNEYRRINLKVFPIC